MLDTLVTLFGGGGFIGRYVAQELLRAGVRVRIAQRDPRQAFFLKPLGGLGQTQFIAADLARPDSVARAVAGAQGVVNLVGTFGRDMAATPRRWRARDCRGGDAGGRDSNGPPLRDRRRCRGGERLCADQGGRRGGGARSLPRRHDPAPIDRVRSRGSVHQPLRRDDRAAAVGPRAARGYQIPAGLCRRCRARRRRRAARSGLRRQERSRWAVPT